MTLIERLKQRYQNGEINDAYIDRLIGKIITTEEANEIKTEGD